MLLGTRTLVNKESAASLINDIHIVVVIVKKLIDWENTVKIFWQWCYQKDHQISPFASQNGTYTKRILGTGGSTVKMSWTAWFVCKESERITFLAALLWADADLHDHMHAQLSVECHHQDTCMSLSRSALCSSPAPELKSNTQTAH
jgi:hypothetical protein